MLKLENLTKSFEATTVLDNISLDLESGETTVILGPSGSGKSTLLRCLNLLETPQSGTLSIEGDLVEFGGKLTDEQVRTIRKHSAMVFQSFNLFPHYTALQNVALAPVLNGKMNKKDANKLASDLLDKVGLGAKKDSYPDNLSGGQQQRVAIARALLSRPEVVFADEPTGNLDSNSGTEVLKLLRDAATEQKQTILMVTHDAHAASYADRVVFLKDGMIAGEMLNPTHDAVLQAMGQLEGK